MVKHIVLWNFREELNDAEKAEAARTVKEKLEALAGVVPGLVSIEVLTEPVALSNRTIMLHSVFEDVAALEGYKVHPAHVKAGEYIRSVTVDRACFDNEC